MPDAPPATLPPEMLPPTLSAGQPPQPPPPPPSLPVQIYANRNGEQIFFFSADGLSQGKPMLAAEVDAMIDGLRALNFLQRKMDKFVRALALSEDMDADTLKARLEA